MEEFKDSDFKKSAKSTATGGCVGVARKPGLGALRNESDKSQGMLVFGDDAMQAFLDSAKAGEFDQI